MDKLKLVEVSPELAGQIEEYIAEFPAERARVTLDPDRIPGLDYFEQFGSAAEWLAFCEEMSGKITWYMTVRESDGRAVGALCFRHRLEYDDDDEDFASHFGYSVRPSERMKGYASEQLRLGLEKARQAGLDRVRLVCRDTNTGSNKVIQANGGVYIDTIHGDQSGLNINRYDILL